MNQTPSFLDVAQRLRQGTAGDILAAQLDPATNLLELEMPLGPSFDHNRYSLLPLEIVTQTCLRDIYHETQISLDENSNIAFSCLDVLMRPIDPVKQYMTMFCLLLKAPRRNSKEIVLCYLNELPPLDHDQQLQFMDKALLSKLTISIARPVHSDVQHYRHYPEWTRLPTDDPLQTHYERANIDPLLRNILQQFFVFDHLLALYLHHRVLHLHNYNKYSTQTNLEQQCPYEETLLRYHTAEMQTAAANAFQSINLITQKNEEVMRECLRIQAEEVVRNAGFDVPGDQ